MSQAPALIQTFSQDLSLGSLSFTFTINKANCGYANPTWAVQEILIGFSVNETETVTVSYINAAGAAFTIVLDTTAIVAGKNYVFRPATVSILNVGDSIKITCTNAGTTGVASGVIKLLPMAG